MPRYQEETVQTGISFPASLQERLTARVEYGQRSARVVDAVRAWIAAHDELEERGLYYRPSKQLDFMLEAITLHAERLEDGRARPPEDREPVDA